MQQVNHFSDVDINNRHRDAVYRLAANVRIRPVVLESVLDKSLSTQVATLALTLPQAILSTLNLRKSV